MPTTPVNETPVLLIIFNRPDKVRILMSALAKIRPKHVYIAADGPRAHVPADTESCKEAREIATTIDWDCEVHTNFQPSNLGCKKGVSSAISWFFGQVPKGIILEDDCIPNESFFLYSTLLLKRYLENNRVMHINGHSFITNANAHIAEPYYFSRIPHVWGWASWARAWEKYDIDTKELATLEEYMLQEEFFTKPAHAHYWTELCHHVQKKHIDTWDTQWVYSILRNNGLCITPTVNLIENVGFDAEATHTKKANLAQHITSTLPEKSLHVFMPSITVHKIFDELEMETIFMPKGGQKIRSLVKQCYHFMIGKKYMI
jgi:hypothetical protein